MIRAWCEPWRLAFGLAYLAAGAMLPARAPAWVLPA